MPVIHYIPSSDFTACGRKKSDVFLSTTERKDVTCMSCLSTYVYRRERERIIRETMDELKKISLISSSIRLRHNPIDGKIHLNISLRPFNTLNDCRVAVDAILEHLEPFLLPAEPRRDLAQFLCQLL